jgi:3-phosphoshikimate 1-carboxyvinyltransferase
MGLLAQGPCRASGWLDAEDTRSSLAAIAMLGARVTHQGSNVTIVPPQNPDKNILQGAEPVTLDCGNSGTTARLICGLLAGWLPVGGPGVILTGDKSLCSRPMGRVVDPLRQMGAQIRHLAGDGLLPVLITGANLEGIRHTLKISSAQVKSALMLAGLGADGTTIIDGAIASRDHTERMLGAMGYDCEPEPGAEEILVTGGVKLNAFSMAVPADPSSAAFFQVAAALIPGSMITVKSHSLNPGRLGGLQVLEKAGAKVEIIKDEGSSEGESIGSVTVSHQILKSFTIAGEDIPALVDEIPILTILATQAEGETIISGAEELRVKESDRLAIMAKGLLAMGADVEERPDGMRISGPTKLRGGTIENPVMIETAGDHRVAMAFAVAALIAEGETVLDDDACVAVSFPNFFALLDQLLCPA